MTWRTMLTGYALLALLATAACTPEADAPKPYPASEPVFRKYYPENEILGLAADRHWREVRASDGSVADIGAWYAAQLARDTLVDDRSDAHCLRRRWQQGPADTIQVTVCDHGSYRTILTVTP